MLGSKAGRLAAGIYLGVAGVSLWRAFDCADQFFCGLRALPMMVPAGLLYGHLFADHLPSPPALQWPLIVPTMATNAAIFYLLGAGVGRLWSRRRGGNID